MPRWKWIVADIRPGSGSDVDECFPESGGAIAGQPLSSLPCTMSPRADEGYSRAPAIFRTDPSPYKAIHQRWD